MKTSFLMTLKTPVPWIFIGSAIGAYMQGHIVQLQRLLVLGSIIFLLLWGVAYVAVRAKNL